MRGFEVWDFSVALLYYGDVFVFWRITCSLNILVINCNKYYHDESGHFTVELRSDHFSSTDPQQLCSTGGATRIKYLPPYPTSGRPKPKRKSPKPLSQRTLKRMTPILCLIFNPTFRKLLTTLQLRLILGCNWPTYSVHCWILNVVKSLQPMVGYINCEKNLDKTKIQ